MLYLQQMKQDMQTEKSSYEKEKVELKAELESIRTHKDQLERILKSQQVSMQVERETHSQIHMETIKVFGPVRLVYF